MKNSAFLRDYNSFGTQKSAPASAYLISHHATGQIHQFPRRGTKTRADASACHRSAHLTLLAKPRFGIQMIVPADMNKNIAVKVSLSIILLETATARCKLASPASTSISSLAAASALHRSAMRASTSTRRHANANVSQHSAMRETSSALKNVNAFVPLMIAMTTHTGTALSVLVCAFHSRAWTRRSGMKIPASASAAL